MLQEGALNRAKRRRCIKRPALESVLLQRYTAVIPLYMDAGRPSSWLCTPVDGGTLRGARQPSVHAALYKEGLNAKLHAGPAVCRAVLSCRNRDLQGHGSSLMPTGTSGKALCGQASSSSEMLPDISGCFGQSLGHVCFSMINKWHDPFL